MSESNNEESVDMNELQSQFNTVQANLKEVVELIQEVFDGRDSVPPAMKARYEAVTKLEEAYMWISNGVQAIIQFDQKVAGAATDLARAAAADPGAAPELKVVK